MNTKTKHETIEVKLYIHARPPWSHSAEEMEKGYGVGANTTDLSSVEGYVFLRTETVSVNVPAGVDVLTGMVDSLKAKQQKIRADAEVECNKIETQIQNMLCIEHQPEVEA